MVRTDKEISDIIDELDSLSIQANALVRRLRRARLAEQGVRSGAQAPRTETYPHGYEVGDRVVITNRYLGQKNTQGQVTHITAQRVTLVDSSGNRYTRKPSNLRKL